MPSLPEYDAAVLAGGRSSRLGGEPKALLLYRGRTLLESTLEAVSGARKTVVAGPPELQPLLAGVSPAPELVREDPPFGGPAAALGAALEALGPDSSPWTLVLACDMPNVSAAVQVLLARAAGEEHSLLALDATGRSQPLAALYRSSDLRALPGLGAPESAPGSLENMSMKALLASVQWRGVDVPPLSTADVDTWADAQALGVNAGDKP